MADDESGNPLIIPPPPAGTPTKAPSAPAKIDRPPADSASFISLPPSVLDSATHRIAATRAERRPVVDDEIVFFPAVPGAAIPDATAPDPARARASGPPAESTAPPTAPPTAPAPVAPPRWRLVLPGGEELELMASVLLGRNPSSAAAAPGARLLRVDDPAKSVSKTHALLEVDGDTVWVHDLGSTNGVYIVEPGREVVEVRPEHRVRLSGAGDLELGEFVIQVRRS